VPVGLGKGNFTTNLAIGTTALNANTADSYNTVIGYQAGRFTTSGYFNTFVGARAGTNLTTGNSNSAFGLDSLGTVSTGANNSAFGLNALGSIGTTSQNTAIGTSAGFLLPVSGYNSASANSVFIGYDTRPAADSQTNQIVIGHSAVGLGSNSVVLGNASITTTALRGNVGIGTTAPTAPLEIRATAIISRESLIKATVSDAGNDAFHIYNATGANNVFAPGFSASTFSTNTGGLIFTSQTTAANDTGTGPLMFYSARITDSQTDPNNGSFSAVSTRPLFAWVNHTTNLMQMAANGNLGIGTTAPAEKLHVLGGKVLFGDAADATGAVGNGDLTLRAYRTPQIHISANNSSGVFYGLNIELNNNIYAGLLLNLSSGEVKIGALAATYFPTFYSNNVERMRIDTAGNVGIGTTAPSSKLHVNGAIIQKPDASATPPANGDLVVEATSNTTLTFKLKGTDGTVRSGTITLA
jgi:hypothetical protein